MHSATIAGAAGPAAGLLTLLAAGPAAASAGAIHDFTAHWAGFLALAIFVGAYVLVVNEESIQMRKSKPVIIAAGLIWAIVALLYTANELTVPHQVLERNLLEYAELFLFLLAAMTFINTLDERGLFHALRAWLVGRGFSFRKLYWLTGAIAFVLSPVADNLTMSLVMATVLVTLGGNNRRFVAVGCINVVVAANAGGAFSPFGDITTLMIWQRGVLDFWQFFALVPPALVNWLVPAALLAFAVPKARPAPHNERSALEHGALVIVGLFALTLAMAVTAHQVLHLPPALGMMTGLGLLKLYGYYLKIRTDVFPVYAAYDEGTAHIEVQGEVGGETLPRDAQGRTPRYNIYRSMERAEWDTLMFFYGIILCVGGLNALGYLNVLSEAMYAGLGPTTANILAGFISAGIDNIPVVFAILEMNPDMGDFQWLLLTLTAGAGGSMLAIGSAAGVAVMGQARNVYTFVSHLKWAWAVVAGYAASIGVHFLING